MIIKEVESLIKEYKTDLSWQQNKRLTFILPKTIFECYLNKRIESIMKSNTSYAEFGLVELDKSHIPQMAEMLATSYYTYPMSKYFFPKEKKRFKQLKTLFTLLSHYALSQGTIVANSDELDGIAMLMDRDPFLTDSNFIKGIVKVLPGFLRFGLPTILRLIHLDTWATQKRRELAPGNHVYFYVLGVDPDYPSHRVAHKLLQKSARYFDAVQKPCYYETYMEKNARHYGMFGWEMIDTTDVPKTDLTCWAGIRMPN